MEQPTTRHSFLDWLSDLETMPTLWIQRCYFEDVINDPISVELHGFGDASGLSFAATVYLRILTLWGIHTLSVASKNRASAIAKLTIPRAELMSAVILARLITKVKNAFSPLIEISSLFCYLDSMTALYWIVGTDKLWNVFTENRVTQIRKKIPIQNWNYVSTGDNPADIPTRPSKFSDLKKNDNY